MTLFVGLGNPGSQYEETRHNIGFKVVDRLIDDFKARDISKTSFHGKLYRSSNLFFLKPTTYMNLSGKSLQAVKAFFKIDIEDIVVIHDDIDIPFGAIRFKKGGGHGGHNGLRSIDTDIGKEYTRIRIGVDKPERKSQVADYVLSDFSTIEQEQVPALIDHVCKASSALLEEKLADVKSYYTLNVSDKQEKDKK